MAIGINSDFHGNVKPSSVEQATFEKDVFALRSMEVPTNLKMRLDYGSRTDGQPEYQGFAPKGLSEDGDINGDGWLLYHFTYTGNNMITRDIAYGNWTNHATATYE